jgi:hypothetical protein
MAGMRFTTTAPAETVIDVAFRQARDLGFAVQEIDDLRLRARRGNLALSIVLGAFIAYCDFRLQLREYDEDNELSIEWSTPWWTGLIGVGRSKGHARKLMTAIGDVLEVKDFEVFDNKEY